MKFHTTFSKKAAICAFAAASAIFASAQVNRSSISGSIKDPDGRLVAGVMVQIVSGASGLHRETASNSDGIYVVAELPTGRYDVTFSRPGFEMVRFENVDQVTGQSRTLNVYLKIALGNESVEVLDPGPGLNQMSGALGSGMEGRQVDNLPLNGRNWSSLTALVAGAIDTGGGNQRSIRFAGRGLDDNNFTFDGVDATGILNQAQKAYVRLAIPTSAISEFQGQSMLYTAETGPGPGGQISIASRAGTNSFHGDAFEFFRNQALSARGPFASGPVPFRLNQFGGRLGGPIARNRTFFSLAVEGLRQNLNQSVIGFVPSAAFSQTTRQQSPQLAPILAAYPAGTQPTDDAKIDEYIASAGQPDEEDSGMLRIDHRLSEQTTFFLRYGQDRATNSAPLGSLRDRVRTDTRPTNGVIQLLHIFGSNILNESSFGLNRVVSFSGNFASLPQSVSVPGFSLLNANSSKSEAGTIYSWIDHLTWTKGRHFVKAGGEVRRVQMNQGNSAGGSLVYSSFNGFGNNLLDQATITAAMPVKGLRKTEFFGFLQDEFRINPNLTLNAGVRYEFYNRFHEILNRAVPFDLATCGGFCPRGSEFGRVNPFNFDPRLTLAWSPDRLKGKTVVRGGFGIYHGDGQLDDQNLPIANDVPRYNFSSAAFPALSYPVEPLLAGATGVLNPRDMDRLRKDMYVAQWGASIQQQLPAEITGTLSYIGSKGTHLLTTSYINVIDPANGTRPYPQFGRIEFRGNQNNSSFEGLQLLAQRTFRNGLLFSGNYLWSHAIDDGSLGGGEADFPENVACRACERASSDQDVRHSFNINGIYALPFGAPGHRDHSGAMRAIFGGWKLSMIATARTGRPMNVTIARNSSSLPDGNSSNQRPDRLPGVPLTPPGGQSPMLWINPAAFAIPSSGTWGNLGRNAIRSPGLYQLDAGLEKSIPVSERIALQLRAEGFNLFNRAQYGDPLTTFSSPASFGRITSTGNTGSTGVGTPRQIQLMMRLEF